MKKNIIFWVTIILLCIAIGIVVYKNGVIKYVESMRVVPRPITHPIQQYTPPPEVYNIKPYSSGGLNEDVNTLIGTYFDENKVPYQNTISLYYDYFVSKGNLRDDYKKKLRDVCNYIIEVVIPNIPTVDDPKKKPVWTRLGWLSDRWTGYNFSFNENAVNNFNLLMGLRNKYGDGSDGKGGASSDSNFDDGSGNGDNNNNNNNNNSGGGGGGGGNNNSRTNSCGSCPIECDINAMYSSQKAGTPSALDAEYDKLKASNFFSNMDDKYKYSNSLKKRGTDGSDGKSRSNGSYGDDGDENTIYKVVVTNEPNKYPQSPMLNDFIKNFIDTWFDVASNPEKPLPTKYAESMFALYTEGKPPIDRNHKNKLRDFVYYFIENIIPGLPTTDKPVSYVEWRPIRYLSNSDL
jgi:hypothetical protein